MTKIINAEKARNLAQNYNERYTKKYVMESINRICQHGGTYARFLLFAPDSLQLVGWMNTDTGDYHVVSPDIVPAECRKLAFSGIHILSRSLTD